MSREIDARVHVEVMGGRFVQEYSVSCIRQVEACRSGEEPKTLTKGVDVPPSAWNGAWPIGALPAYSTDPAAAMEVVERMRTRAAGIDIFIRHPDNPKGHPAFCCYMHSFVESAWKEGRLDEDASAEADTLPMAVCLSALAALRAVGGEGGRT